MRLSGSHLVLGLLVLVLVAYAVTLKRQLDLEHATIAVLAEARVAAEEELRRARSEVLEARKGVALERCDATGLQRELKICQVETAVLKAELRKQEAVTNDLAVALKAAPGRAALPTSAQARAQAEQVTASPTGAEEAVRNDSVPAASPSPAEGR